MKHVRKLGVGGRFAKPAKNCSVLLNQVDSGSVPRTGRLCRVGFGERVQLVLFQGFGFYFGFKLIRLFFFVEGFVWHKYEINIRSNFP